MLSVAALVLFSLFSISQQRRLVFAEQTMIRNTVASMANGVAVQILDEAASNAFDEKTKGGARVTSSSDLTPKDEFGTDGGSFLDLDDYSIADDDRTLHKTRDVDGAPLVFEWSAEVNYVKIVGGNWTVPADPSERTKYKQIEVTVYPQDISIADTVRVKQVVSCGQSCQF